MSEQNPLSLNPYIEHIKEAHLEQLRDQFAMAALTGLLARPLDSPNLLTEEAYMYADAMLEARKK